MRRLAVLVLAALAGCSGVDEGTRVESAPGGDQPAAVETTPRATVHRESRLACNHFRNVARDVGRGVLTDVELRKKLKEVDDDAVIATPQVRSAATAMLAAMTTGTASDLLEAIGEMDSACSTAGH